MQNLDYVIATEEDLVKSRLKKD